MNDWIIANINNPDFSIADFQHIADMNSENTQLLKYEDYLKKDFIVNHDAFKNDNGDFDEKLFKDYYVKKGKEFQQFSEYEYFNLPEYSIWDVRRTKDTNVWNPNLQLATVYNPDRRAIGIEGLGVVSEPTQTISEIAQTQKIYDPANDEFLDYTPNDYALFKKGNVIGNIIDYAKFLFGEEPLVLAQYDSDGYHIENGRKIKHTKGEYKLNEEGTYYTEKLNGRSTVGKQFISATDLITVDGSSINKYDFFDSDGMDKSAVETTVKNLVVAAPLMFLGPVGAGIYSGLFIARELSKSLPMLADIVTLFGDDVDNKILNNIAGWGHKFTGSTSEYAKNNLFSYENIGNLASDVVLQWGQMKTIANTTRKLLGAGDAKMASAYAKAAQKYSDEASTMVNNVINGKVPLKEAQSYIGTSITRLKDIPTMIKSGAWKETPLGQASLRQFVPAAESFINSRAAIGQNLALAYMAVVSNTDVYERVLAKGGTNKEAAAMALGSAVGMYSVDKFLGLDKLFFDNTSNQYLFRQVAKKSADEIMDGVNLMGKSAAKEGAEESLNWIKRGLQVGKNTVNNYREGLKNNTLGFLGKSIGEGLEEVSEEVVADLSKTLGEIAGEFGLASQTDYGAWENPLERYAMSMFGGALGGGMFYTINAASTKTGNKQTEQELIYLIRNGKTKEILNEIEKLHKRGKLASTSLSINTSQGNFVSADENNQSQNDYVYARLKEAILQMDNIINENKLNLNENQLFDKLVLSESRFLKLRDYLQDKSYITGYQQEYQNLISELISVDERIEKLNKETKDTDKRNNPKYTHALEELEAERKYIIDKRNKFLSGEYSAHYLKKLLFAIDTNLSEPFVSLNYDQFVRHNFGKDVRFLSNEEKETYSELYKSYIANSKKRSLSEAFRIYEAMEQELTPIVEKINEEDVLSWGKVIEQLNSSTDQIVTWDSQLEGESEEDYKYRDTPMDDEDEVSFDARRELRKNEIIRLNEEISQKFYEEFIKGQGKIDQGAYRQLSSILNVRRKDIINSHIDRLYSIKWKAGDYDYNDNKLITETREILQQLHTTSIDEVREQVRALIRNRIENELQTLYKEELSLFNQDGTYDFISGEEEFNIEPIEGNVLTNKHIFDYFDSIINNDYSLSSDDIRDMIIKRYGQEGPSIRDKGFFQYDPNIVAKWIEDYIKYKDNQLLSREIDVQLSTGILTEEQAKELKQELIDENLPKQIVGMSQEVLQDKVKEYEHRVDYYVSEIEKNILNEIKSDKWINIMDQFKEKISIDANPVLQLLEYTNPILGSFQGLNVQLQEIIKQWEELENPVDFELNEPQIEVLRKAVEQLDFIKAFIYSASAIPNFTNPTGHNRALNEFAKKNSTKITNWKPLPEISQDVSNVYLSEIERFIKEANTWVNISNNNSVNKREEFKQTDKALLKARLEFYKSNKLVLKDGTNLLEGWNDTGEITLSNLVAADETVYNNFWKAVKEGKSDTEMLTELLNDVTNINNVYLQITTPINRTISYSKYSDYDKFILLTSIIASRDSEFYTKLKNHINSNPKTKDGNLIAPLSVQEYSERVAEAVLKNPEFINKALEIVNENSTVKLPIIKNSVLIPGLGGAGKTDVVAREIVSNIDPKRVWLSGPTEAQIDTLQKVIKDGKEITLKDLLIEAIGEEQTNKLLSQNEAESLILKYFTKGTTPEGPVYYYNGENLSINKIENAPEAIIIDEVTHINGMALQILGEWANLNNIKLILVGDENQKGYEGIGLNVDREKVLMWRAPRLGISLRDSTYQKVKNLQSVLTLSEELRTSVNLTPERLNQIYNDDIHNIEFKYYLEDDHFSGELLTKELTPNIIKHLKGVVGYVGQDDEYYKMLKNSGVNVELLPANKIQGREYDYVVINKTWEEIEQDDSGLNAYRFLQDLYTLMSRSKEGTVFIDKGLSNIIKNKQEFTYTRVTSIKDAAEEFRSYKLNELEHLKLPVYEEEAETVVEEETDKEQGENDDEFPVNPIQKTKEVASETEIETVKQSESLNINHPIRVYGNVHLLGVDRTTDVVGNKKIHSWIRPQNGPAYDAGIFMEKGQVVNDPTTKNDIVTQLLQLKSVLLFDYENKIDALPIALKNKFRQDSFDNIEYYINIKKSDHLVGGTNLSNEGLYVKDDNIISVVAKLKMYNQDNTSEDCYITLGTLASPDTWESNKKSIIKALEERIKEEPDNSDIKFYHDNFDGIIMSYRNTLDELISKGEGLVRRIDAPNFTAMTELIFKDANGNELTNVKLEDLNSDRSLWQESNPYAIVSDVHLLMRDDLGLNLKKGTAVRYVTSNMLLDSTGLKQIYEEQKTTPGKKPQVRLQVLHNDGVSFRSLFQSKYKDLYTTKIKNNIITFPINLHYQSMNMFRSIWNFRANLIKFNTVLEEWKSTQQLTNEDVNKLIKLDAEEYIKALNKLKEDLKSSGKVTESELKYIHLSESDYREACKEHENYELLKKLWDFNDSLATSVRQFRLGYSKLNGAYLRQLTNIKPDNVFYSNVKNPIGIYINPELSIYYENVLNNLFDQFLNKIIDMGDVNLTYHIDKQKKDWYKRSLTDVTFNLWDIDENSKKIDKVINVNVPQSDTLKAIPVLLTEMAKYIQYYSQDKQFFKDIHQDGIDEEGGIKEGVFKIKLGEEEINYIDIFDIDNTVFETSEDIIQDTIPGVHKFSPNSKDEVLMDFRINNLWDLMFHGSIENASNNDFSNIEFVATDAYFKDGIHHDPIMFPAKGTDPQAMVRSSKKFFSTDCNVGFPLFYVNLAEYTPETNSTETVELETKTKIETESMLPGVQRALDMTQMNLNIYNSPDGKNKLINLVNREIKTNLEQYFNKNQIDIALNELLYSAEYTENGDIVYTTFVEYLGLNEDILNMTFNDSILIIELSDKILELQYLDGDVYQSVKPKENKNKYFTEPVPTEPVIKEQTEEKTESIEIKPYQTGEEIKNEIINYFVDGRFKVLFDYYASEMDYTLEQFAQYINEVWVNNNVPTNTSPTEEEQMLIRTTLNEILEGMIDITEASDEVIQNYNEFNEYIDNRYINKFCKI